MSAFMKLGNFFIRLVLASPLHALMSGNTLLVHFTGHKSGRSFTTPVNYTQEDGVIRIISRRERVWWRNLREAAAVSLTLRGRRVSGAPTVIETPEAVAAGLAGFLRPKPDFARYYQVRAAEDGSFNQEDLLRQAEDTVVIEIMLESGTS